MYIKKINTILISLMLIFTFSISVISMDTVFAYAENIRDTKFEKIEKISIKTYEPVERSDDAKLLHFILLQLHDKNIDEETRQTLITLANYLQAKLVPIPTAQHVAEINELSQEIKKLINAYHQDEKFTKWMNTELVGFGIDEKQELLFIDIEPSFANQKNAIKYKEKIKSILSPSTEFEFRQIERPQSVGCNSLVSDCDPLQGGVKISIDGGTDCSVGFKAKDGNTEGFITAGHCGEVDSDVKFPNSDDKIGEVTRDGFTVGDSMTFCDCLFVEMTEDVTVDNLIFANVTVNGIGTPLFMDTVYLVGFASGEFTGDIIATNYGVSIDGMLHQNHLRIDSAPNSGDSGGPIYKLVNEDAKLLGFISAVQSSQYTIASPLTYLGYELSNITLDFD